MEHLWSRAVATGGNRWQMRQPRNRLRHAKTVAVGCGPLPRRFHGKEGVDVDLLCPLRSIRGKATGSRTHPALVAIWATTHPAFLPHEAPRDPRPHPRIPATPRSEALLSPRIPAYPGPGRKHHDRPVTPEVAGLSPVAPVQKSCKSTYCVASLDTAATRGPHRRVLEAVPGRRKAIRSPFAYGLFKPDRGEQRRPRTRLRRPRNKTGGHRSLILSFAALLLAHVD